MDKKIVVAALLKAANLLDNENDELNANIVTAVAEMLSQDDYWNGGDPTNNARQSAKRYVLRYGGRDAQQLEDERNQLNRFAGVNVLDNSARMLLVEASDQTIESLTQRFPTWMITPENIQATTQPATQRIRRDAQGTELRPEKYILKFAGGPDGALEYQKDEITRFPGVSVENEGPTVMLIQADSRTANAIRHGYPNWIVKTEDEYLQRHAAPPSEIPQYSQYTGPTNNGFTSLNPSNFQPDMTVYAGRNRFEATDPNDHLPPQKKNGPIPVKRSNRNEHLPYQ